MAISSGLSIVPLAGTCSGTTAFPRFSKLIEQTTYKPGTQLLFEGYDDWKPATVSGLSLFPNEGPRHAKLTLKILTVDSRNPGSEAKMLQFSMVITPMVEEYDDNYMKYYLRHFLESYEQHEIDEWFQIDGKLVNDPHAKEGQGKNAR